jgi:ATP-dependent Clp protease ATP-binding subunit ClpB
LNRVDEIVVFHMLSRENLARIMDIQLRRVNELMSESAREYLAEAGYDPDFGARPLKRAIQREMQDPLALKIVSGDFRPGETIRVDLGGGELKFSAVLEGEVVV